MTGLLENKVAVITGAGRGIGKAIALVYAENGAKVCCMARSKHEIDETVTRIKNGGGEALAISCDVTDYQSLENAFEKAVEEFGAVDIVVIDAGVDCDNSPVDELDLKVWKDVIETNLTGAFYTAKVSIPYLKKRSGGKIITIGSGLGHKGREGKAPYSCSKAGLWMLTRVLAQELSQYDISVNELIPGPVNTNMGNDCKKDNKSVFSIDDEWIKTPDDVRNIAMFLATQPLIGPTAQSYSLMRRDL